MGSALKKNASLIIAIIVLFLFIVSGKNTPKPDDRVASLFVTAMPTAVSSAPTIIYPSPTVYLSVSPDANETLVQDQQRTVVKVINVVDGDTIKIDTGETVRYIGIDTPESVDPRKPVQCFAKEASAKNEELVLGKIVELEKDISDRDKYGRLLRYIRIGEVLINEVLVREGYAHSYSYPPDIKYQDRFIEAQRLAREEQKGLWGDVCQIQPTSEPTAKTVIQGSFVCDCSKSCAKMSSCSEAQYQLKVCGCSARDGDGDGIACDSECQ